MIAVSAVILSAGSLLRSSDTTFLTPGWTLFGAKKCSCTVMKYCTIGNFLAISCNHDWLVIILKMVCELGGAYPGFCNMKQFI